MNNAKMEADDLKQVILVRNDLKMSPGKAAAQVGHAAILFMIDAVRSAMDNGTDVKHLMREYRWMFDNGPIHNDAGSSVAYGGMKKIVLGVKNLSELWLCHWCAKDLGLKVFNVFDESLDEITCCAIGPEYAEKIDKVTGYLPLYGNPKHGEAEASLSDWTELDDLVEEMQPTKSIVGEDVWDGTCDYHPCGEMLALGNSIIGWGGVFDADRDYGDEDQEKGHRHWKTDGVGNYIPVDPVDGTPKPYNITGEGKAVPWWWKVDYDAVKAKQEVDKEPEKWYRVTPKRKKYRY